MDQIYINWAEKQMGNKFAVHKEPHGDQSTVYGLESSTGNYFLKIAPELTKERQRLEWLNGKASVPKVIGFVRIEDKDALLLSVIEGKNLAKLSKEWPTDTVITKLAEALRQFHAIDAKDCPFGERGQNRVLVHGDACLPNFIFNNDHFSGYIDLGEMTVDNPEVDLAAAIWSLQYNLGPGHGLEFLKKYGAKDATEELVEKLRLQYEKMQEEWGLL